jgi:cytochrome c oxidase assembly protein subunit 15
VGVTPTTAGPDTVAPADRTASWMRALAWATLLANVVIVVTGGLVRLTGSGLGCPTWPQCTDGSFVPHRALGVHGAIEFGNRTLTFVLAAVAIATYVVARRHGRASLRRLAFWLALSVPAQAVLGGITVLTDLNPWVVGLHMMFSMGVIAGAVVLLRRTEEGDGPAVVLGPPSLRRVAQAAWVAAALVLYAGTVVTGSGPHAGDSGSARNDLDPGGMSQLHADLVFLLVGLTVAAVILARTSDAPASLRRAAALLLAVELAQGVLGYVQYFTGLPVAVVALHLLGAALLAASATWLLVSTRVRA